MRAIIKVSTLAALLAAGAAFAQTPTAPASSTTGAQSTDYSKLDANGDGMISKEEAKADPALAAQFGELDADKNGTLSSSELAKAGLKQGKDGY